MSLRHHPEIERALRFIADNLEAPITVADVARAAHLSEFHFHRLFHALVGEPIGRYVTRRRLEQAALRLAYERDRSITDIALSSGYSSTSNFSKAFNAFFGCSPSQVRQPAPELPAIIGRLTSQYGRGFRPQDLYVVPLREPEELRARARPWDEVVRYEDFPGLDFACLASPGGYDLETQQETWVELIRAGRQLGVCDDPVDAWGRAFDSPHITAPELCRYHACIPCPADFPLPPPLFRGYMEPGRYAVFPYAGPVTGIELAYRTIFSCWFPTSSVAPEDLEPFDHYVGDEPKEGQVVLEIWVKIRART